MKTTTIEQLAYIMKQAKKRDKPKPIFFLGAGASKTAGIRADKDWLALLAKYS